MTTPNVYPPHIDQTTGPCHVLTHPRMYAQDVYMRTLEESIRGEHGSIARQFVLAFAAERGIPIPEKYR